MRVARVFGKITPTFRSCKSFRLYSTQLFKQSAKPSPKFNELKEQADNLDKLYENPNFTQLQRILINKPNKNDLKVKINDPKVINNWVNQSARDGPKFLTLSYEERAKPVTVTVTGAAGSIAYSLIPRILNGEVFGKNQPINLKLLEVPQAIKALEGVVMEIQDFAFPLLNEVVATSDEKEAFSGTDFAILVGAKPRGKGMERGDLLNENAKIFASQGKALNDYAKPETLVTVVGNPANTNALVASANAPNIPAKNFTALTRLDHDRALTKLAKKLGIQVTDIHRFCIWGNHSATQYPDLSFATVGPGTGTWALSLLKGEEKWVQEDFIKGVQQRGAEIINVMGKSSAMSAADATIKHLRDWVQGNNEWVSMAVHSDGSYGVPRDIFSSFPLICQGRGEYGIIKGLPIDEFSAKLINNSVNELLEEREAVKKLIPSPVKRFVSLDKSKIYTSDFLVYNDVEIQKEQRVLDN